METASSLKSSTKVATSNIGPQPTNFQTMTNANNVTSHPLASHPFFKYAIDRLCPNLINLLDSPGKL